MQSSNNSKRKESESQTGNIFVEARTENLPLFPFLICSNSKMKIIIFIYLLLFTFCIDQVMGAVGFSHMKGLSLFNLKEIPEVKSESVATLAGMTKSV